MWRMLGLLLWYGDVEHGSTMWYGVFKEKGLTEGAISCRYMHSLIHVELDTYACTACYISMHVQL